MIKKAECEQAIRHLATEWAEETGYVWQPGHYPSFGAFRTWMEARHLGHYFNFRSGIGARHEAEGWFEAELRNWRRPREPRPRL